MDQFRQQARSLPGHPAVRSQIPCLTMETDDLTDRTAELSRRGRRGDCGHWLATTR